MRTLFLALAIWPTLYHAACSADRQNNPPVNFGWYADRMEHWDTLLKQAGQNIKGLVLEARIINDSKGSPLTLVLGVRNVGDAPVVTYWGIGDNNPILLLRNGRTSRLY